MATQPRVDEWVGAGDCPRCGTSYAALQEYCLECGLRLPEEPAAEEESLRGRLLPPGSPALWPLLATLVVAMIALATILAVRFTGDDGDELVVATTSVPTVVPATQPEPIEEPPLPTLPTPATTPARTAPTTTTAPPATNELIEWPGQDGWTIVLLSATSRSTATARGREALEAGVEEVGVLESSQYASLHPGYFVVFAGVFESRSEAQSALDGVQGRGYDAAYVREIASSR